jgi:hypothetical protein
MMGRNSADVNLSLRRLMRENPQSARSLSAAFGSQVYSPGTKSRTPDVNGSQLTGLERNGYAWARYWAFCGTN